jgi:hypothetical protein
MWVVCIKRSKTTQKRSIGEGADLKCIPSDQKATERSCFDTVRWFQKGMPFKKHSAQHGDAIARRFLDQKARHQELLSLLLYESEINKTRLIL